MVSRPPQPGGRARVRPRRPQGGFGGSPPDSPFCDPLLPQTRGAPSLERAQEPALSRASEPMIQLFFAIALPALVLASSGTSTSLRERAHDPALLRDCVARPCARCAPQYPALVSLLRPPSRSLRSPRIQLFFRSGEARNELSFALASLAPRRPLTTLTHPSVTCTRTGWTCTWTWPWSCSKPRTSSGWSA